MALSTMHNTSASVVMKRQKGCHEKDLYHAQLLLLITTNTWAVLTLWTSTLATIQ